MGGRYPSGKYTILTFDGDRLVESNESIDLPDWLQFEVNEEGFPCYVRSLLALFPELKGTGVYTPSADRTSDERYTAENQKYSDAFDRAINTIETNQGDINSLFELPKDALIRVIEFAKKGYRGNEITPRMVTQNHSNREAGVRTTVEAKEALDMLVYLKLAQCTQGGASYWITG